MAESAPRASREPLACEPSPAVRAWLAQPPGGLAPEDALFAAFAASWLARVGDAASFDLGLSDAGLRERVRGLEALFAAQVPVALEVDFEAARLGAGWRRSRSGWRGAPATRASRAT